MTAGSKPASPMDTRGCGGPASMFTSTGAPRDCLMKIPTAIPITAMITTTSGQTFFIRVSLMHPSSAVSQGVTGYRSALRELEHVRGVCRPLVAVMRGDDAAAARFEPAVEAPRKIGTRGAIEPGERLVQQRERGFARPGAGKQHAARLAIRHFGQR